MLEKKGGSTKLRDLRHIRDDVRLEVEVSKLSGGAFSEKDALLIIARLAQTADAGFLLERIKIDAVDAGMVQEAFRFAWKAVDEAS